ncbi:uridine phosphorylase 1-like [Saccoglossus kowalevskii]
MEASQEGMANNSSGSAMATNPHLLQMEEDVLYHFGLSTKKNNLQAMFGEVKFVCTGGSSARMEVFAKFMLEELHMHLPAGMALCNICSTDRYAMYKVGPVLVVSHGMGMPSISIMLHEVIKLLEYAQCKDLTFFRIGTCGGLGLKPGSVVVTETAVDYKFEPVFELQALGKIISTPTNLNKDLAQDLLSCSDQSDEFDIVVGNTMCTNDFYEGQGRLDGAFCDYTEQDKMNYLHELYNVGIRNIEMESLCFASMMNRAGIKAGVVCVTILDRLKGDQVVTPKEELRRWEERPQTVVARYIKGTFEKKLK